MPAKNGSVCLQELKQTATRRVYTRARAGARTRGRVGPASKARRPIGRPDWRMAGDCAAGNTKGARRLIAAPGRFYGFLEFRQ